MRPVVIPRRAPLALGAVAALMCGACVTEENDDPAIAGKIRLEALTPAPVNESLAPVDRPHTVAERDQWEPILVLVPPDSVAHHPLYRTRFGEADTNRRERGEYPTPLSSLDLTTRSSERDQQREALLAPLVAAGDVLLMIPRAISRHRYDLKRSPWASYRRYWMADDDSGPVQPPDAGPDTLPDPAEAAR